MVLPVFLIIVLFILLPIAVSSAAAIEPTFVDVPLDHPYYVYIEALYQQGYVAGCSLTPLKYCPDDSLTRAEEAVFVERGFRSAGYEPPPATTQIFVDVDPSVDWFADWVTMLYEDGLTAGCATDPLAFCPLQGNTIAEGSVFMLKIKYGAEYVPPQPAGIFADVTAGSWYEPWVEAAYNADILVPCQIEPELLACPQELLRRDVAAYMMVLARDLLLPTPTPAPTLTAPPTPVQSPTPTPGPSPSPGNCAAANDPQAARVEFSPAPADSYHVDVHHPRASDTNPGTQAEPWLTIQHAADVLRAGEAVIVHAGSYAERVSTMSSGSDGAHIVFFANGDATMGGFNIDHDYIAVVGFNITGDLPNAYSGYIDVDDESDYIAILNNIIRGSKADVQGILFRPHEATKKTTVDHPSNAVIKNNVFENLDYHMITLNGTDHIVIDNEFKNSGWDVIRFFGKNHLIRRNYIHDINRTGVTHTDLFQTFGVWGARVENIHFSCNMAVNCESQIGNFETTAKDGTTPQIGNFLFQNNVFVNIGSTANIYVEGVKWVNNTFFDVAWINRNWSLAFLSSSSSGKGHAHKGMALNNMFIGCADNRDNRGWYTINEGLSGMVTDYNYVSKSDGTWSAYGDFNEPHGINGGNPYFLDVNDPLGPDGALFTGDDGLRPLSQSPACGSGVEGVDIGAYSCSE